jgi:hypothetical protein
MKEPKYRACPVCGGGCRVTQIAEGEVYSFDCTAETVIFHDGKERALHECPRAVRSRE